MLRIAVETPDADVSDDYYCDEVLSGKVDVRVVAETDRVLAFHHTFRSWDTHIVVIPKEHVRRLVDVVDTTLLTEIMEVMTGIIKTLGLADSNYKIITNGGAYQSSQHLHFHLVSGQPMDPGNVAQQGELAV